MSEQKQEKEITEEEKTKETLEKLDKNIKECEQKIKDVEMKAKQKHEEAELKSKAGDEEGAKSLLAEEAKLLEQKKSIEGAMEMFRAQKEMLGGASAMKDFIFKVKGAGDNVEERQNIFDKFDPLKKESKKDEKK